MAIAIVHSSNKEAWHAERAKGVTATQAARLHNAGISTRRKVAEGDANFKGNRHTERGLRLEPIIQQWVTDNLGIEASGMLYAHDGNSRHLATPDAVTFDDGEAALVEIKTHIDDWGGIVPRRYLLQVLWQAYVLAAGYAAVAHMRVDEHGQPLSLAPELIEINLRSDENRKLTRELIESADAYLGWRDAGCPDHDEPDVPRDVVEAVETYNRAKADLAAAEATIRDYLKDASPDRSFKRSLPTGGISWQVTESSEFDTAAWESADPEGAAAFADATAAKKAAEKTYRKPKRRTSLTIEPLKEAA